MLSNLKPGVFFLLSKLGGGHYRKEAEKEALQKAAEAVAKAAEAAEVAAARAEGRAVPASAEYRRLVPGLFG